MNMLVLQFILIALIAMEVMGDRLVLKMSPAMISVTTMRGQAYFDTCRSLGATYLPFANIDDRLSPHSLQWFTYNPDVPIVGPTNTVIFESSHAVFGNSLITTLFDARVCPDRNASYWTNSGVSSVRDGRGALTYGSTAFSYNRGWMNYGLCNTTNNIASYGLYPSPPVIATTISLYGTYYEDMYSNVVIRKNILCYSYVTDNSNPVLGEHRISSSLNFSSNNTIVYRNDSNGWYVRPKSLCSVYPSGSFESMYNNGSHKLVYFGVRSGTTVRIKSISDNYCVDMYGCVVSCNLMESLSTPIWNGDSFQGSGNYSIPQSETSLTFDSALAKYVSHYVCIPPSSNRDCTTCIGGICTGNVPLNISSCVFNAGSYLVTPLAYPQINCSTTVGDYTSIMGISVSLTRMPTRMPTMLPTPPTTLMPTLNPTLVPTRNPTNMPTSNPTFGPTALPSKVPTSVPTMNPTFDPTSNPTSNPTLLPTFAPSTDPTTINPTTRSPSMSPGSPPTLVPTRSPTSAPTKLPTSTPTTKVPTIMPSVNATSDAMLCGAYTFTAMFALYVYVAADALLF